MKWAVIIFINIWFVAPVTVVAQDNTKEFNQLFDELLKQYWRPTVTVNGIPTTVFDYAKMREDSLQQDSLFKRVQRALKVAKANNIESKNTAVAFWINAYNFGAIQLVINNYPVPSIRSFKISLFKHPWSKKVVSVGGRVYSLKEIEKDVLLNRYGDIRILFAVSCAAVSCPDRTPEAFIGNRLDQQLDDLIRTFFANDKKGFNLDREKKLVTLSWILDKDGDLITERYRDVINLVLPYLSKDDQQWMKTNRYDIQYFEHDWTLNDLAQAFDQC